MNNDNYNFWKMAFDMKAIDINTLRKAVKTQENPFGEISEAEFKVITGVDFEVKPVAPVSTNGESVSNPEVKGTETTTKTE